MTVQQIIEISQWVDRGLADKSAEAQLWQRVAKIGEEHGEVIQALIGYTNGNPRKPNSHTLDDIRKELLDVALCALAAWVHVAHNQMLCDPLRALENHTQAIHWRAGLNPLKAKAEAQSAIRARIDPDASEGGIEDLGHCTQPEFIDGYCTWCAEPESSHHG